MAEQNAYIRWFDELTKGDVGTVGGKNASLGEMVQTLKEEGIRVPDGFATTADAYWTFLEANNLVEELRSHLDRLDREEQSLKEAGKAIRRLFGEASFPEEVAEAIRAADHEAGRRHRDEPRRPHLARRHREPRAGHPGADRDGQRHRGALRRAGSDPLLCRGGRGLRLYEGLLAFEEHDLDLEDVPETETRIMLNIASPPAAMRWWQLPVQGIGLARMEYIVNNIIKIHPLALQRFDQVEDDEARDEIERLTTGYDDKARYFVDHLAWGIATIAASQYPDPVIVRTSDFKTNEYADLIGGRAFEPKEENPMLGWRGASRYYSEDYRDGFALECQALKKVREIMGFDNIVVMIPFCRPRGAAGGTDGNTCRRHAADGAAPGHHSRASRRRDARQHHRDCLGQDGYADKE